jgi:hypothetical protein
LGVAVVEAQVVVVVPASTVGSDAGAGFST